MIPLFLNWSVVIILGAATAFKHSTASPAKKKKKKRNWLLDITHRFLFPILTAPSHLLFQGSSPHSSFDYLPQRSVTQVLSSVHCSPLCIQSPSLIHEGPTPFICWCSQILYLSQNSPQSFSPPACWASLLWYTVGISRSKHPKLNSPFFLQIASPQICVWCIVGETNKFWMSREDFELGITE